MKNFVVTIVGICVLDVLIGLVVGDGKISKFVKSTISVFTLYMLVTALENLLKTAKII